MEEARAPPPAPPAGSCACKAPTKDLAGVKTVKAEGGCCGGAQKKPTNKCCGGSDPDQGSCCKSESANEAPASSPTCFSAFDDDSDDDDGFGDVGFDDDYDDSGEDSDSDSTTTNLGEDIRLDATGPPDSDPFDMLLNLEQSFIDEGKDRDKINGESMN